MSQDHAQKTAADVLREIDEDIEHVAENFVREHRNPPRPEVLAKLETR